MSGADVRSIGWAAASALRLLGRQRSPLALNLFGVPVFAGLFSLTASRPHGLK